MLFRTGMATSGERPIEVAVSSGESRPDRDRARRSIPPRGLAAIVGLLAAAAAVPAACTAESPAPREIASTEPPPIEPAMAALSRADALRARFPRELAPAPIEAFARRDGAIAVVARGAAEVELPIAAAGPVRVTDRASRIEARFTLDGATPAPFAGARGLALYPGGGPAGADLVHRPSGAGTEDFVIFAERPAREELRYSLETAGFAGLRLANGALELLDAGGAPRLRVARPWVVDADGKRALAALSVEGCAVDRSPRPPWGRAVTPPGAARCAVIVDWSPAAVRYPALVDPQWIATTFAMTAARTRHTATLLDPAAPAGLVLIAGGYDSGGTALDTAELYEPLSRTFAGTGKMTAKRGAHTATRLLSGASSPVLIAGGTAVAQGAPLSTTELFDPSTGTFSAHLAMPVPRASHTATRLDDGSVLVAGGTTTLNQSLKNAEVYTANSVTALAGLVSARAGHAATRLAVDGPAAASVLITGGLLTGGFAQPTAEVFDAATSTFALVVPVGNASAQITGARAFHTATLVVKPDQSIDGVLVAGGVNDASGTTTWDTAQLYVDTPQLRGFLPVVQMKAHRSSHAASLLPSGDVLLAGGHDGAGEVASTEIWSGGSFALLAPMLAARRGHTALAVNAGESIAAGDGVLVTGGNGSPTQALGSAEVLLRPLADACTLDAECASGHCTAGICCDTPCTEVCRSCTAAGKGAGADGVCGNSADGTDIGYQCVNAINVHRKCDGAGNVVPDSIEDCKPNACAADGVSCATLCNADLACASTGWCSIAGDPDAGTCLKKQEISTQCDVDEQCISGHCSDGVCCDVACTAPCKACDLVGATGTCSLVGELEPAPIRHPDPINCVTSDATCAAFCNGVNASCVYPDATKICGTAECACADGDCTVGPATVTTFACDSAGACAPAGTDCGGKKCGAAGACLAACASNDDCLRDFVCDTATGACEALTAPTCDGDHTVLVPGGASEDCAPYRCRKGENGAPDACRDECTTVKDCVGRVCDTANECVPALEAPEISSCAASPGRPVAAWAAGLIALAFAAARHARRRGSRA